MLLLTNARLFDGTSSPVRDGAWVLIDGERISAIGDAGQPAPSSESAEVFDLSGHTLLPGLINSHVHLHLDGSGDTWRYVGAESGELRTLRAVAAAATLLNHGITSVVDLGAKGEGIVALRQAVDEGLFPGPRIQSAGRAICMTGGHFRVAGAREADGVPEVLRAVREELEKGADLIKFMATSGMHAPPGFPVGAAELTYEELRAGVEATHARGRKARAHAIGTEGIKNAARAGIDTVEHAPFLDDEAIELLLASGTTIVPTMIAYIQIMEHGGQGAVSRHAGQMAAAVHEAHLDAVNRAYRAGIPIAVGTDGGSPFNAHEDIVSELALLAKADVPRDDVLRMATANNARVMGREGDLGTVEAGKLADLIAVKGNPIGDLSLLREPDLVIKGGQVVRRR